MNKSDEIKDLEAQIKNLNIELSGVFNEVQELKEICKKLVDVVYNLTKKE